MLVVPIECGENMEEKWNECGYGDEMAMGD
jgi:hypothetical protein